MRDSLDSKKQRSNLCILYLQIYLSQYYQNVYQSDNIYKIRPMNTQHKMECTQGFLFPFNSSIAYISNPKSSKFLLFLDGMFGMMLSIPYFRILKQFCQQNAIALVYPQLRSHPHYQIHKIEHDIQDIVDIIKRLDGEVIIMGHSTGCQDCLLYLSHGKDSKVKGVILQAPVSDIEGRDSLKLQKSVLEAKQSGKYYISEQNVWLSERFITVFEKRNKQDLFSSYLPDEQFKKWKTLAPILSILSLKDEYCQHNLSEKFELMGKVFPLQNGNHSVSCEQDQVKLIQRIRDFLKQIGFI